MLSAPAAIPAMIEVSLPAGFTPAEVTLLACGSSTTRSEINSDNPARSARPITGASPANDTRCSSSKTGAARDQPCDSLTESAFRNQVDLDLNNPDSPDPEGTFSINAPNDQLPIHGLRLRAHRASSAPWPWCWLRASMHS
jgi:hypothetical protein